ncbi:MAG: amidohydrolase family protein [Clostridia bacterium]|nr:amidohydrolase family protein [Clostridia bacterium]
MEKVYDIHIHLSFDIPMQEMVKVFEEEFKETGTEKYCFLCLPHHANGKNKLFLSATQNLKGLFLKNAFAPNGYAFAGLVHPQEDMPSEERAEIYYKQAVEYHNAGYDGIKMLEGHPTFSRVLGRTLDDKVYDKFYKYLEENQIPIILHVADPEGSWDMDTASEVAKALGRTYCDGYPSKRQLTDEVFGVLKKYPNLKLGLAHFGFMSYDINEAQKFISYKNTFFDLTPGGEQLIKMAETWDEWLKFFTQHQDEIVYGSDFYAFPKQDEKEWRTAFHRRPDFVRQLLETDKEHLYIDQKFRGVNIDKSLRDKIYRENFVKLLGEPRKINKEYFHSEAKRLLKVLPNGDKYYIKDRIIDITIPENLEFVTRRYISDINFMCENFDKKN